MNSFHGFSRFIGICKWTTSHQAINIESEDTIEIENVEASPSLQKLDHQNLLALPINSGSFWNDVAPIEEGSLSQSFSRLHQRVIFNFLTGHGEVERLPCSEILDNQELYGLSRTTSSLEKIHQEVFQLPDQQSIFKFLNGDVFQLLVFLLVSDLESNSVLDTCGDLTRCLSQMDLENSRDKSACFDNTRKGVQDNGPCSIVHHKLQLTDYYATEHLTTDPTVKMNGFTEVIDGNIHSECSFSTSNPFFDSPLHYYQETFNCIKVSDMVIELGSEANQSYLIENLSGMLSKSNCGAEVFEQTTTTYQENLTDFCQHPTNGNYVEATFAIPDPDELLEYLHGTISSPKFLASDTLNGESDNLDFSSHFGYCSPDEVEKLDSITNSSGETLGIDNEYDMFDTLDYEIGSEIGAMTGSFGEMESPDLPSLPDPSQIEQIRWNWSSRDVDFSHFNFDDHEDLLELYELNKPDAQANDDKFCNSPTWPGKRFSRESDLEYDCCKIASQAHEKLHESSASRIYYHQRFDDVSGSQYPPPRIHINTTYQYRNTASLNASGTSGHSFGYFQEYLAIGSDEELKFTIPDPDELMKFLHGNLSSPKFLASDPPNWESDNNHLPSNVGIRSSDEVAKSDNLSGSITNSSITDAKNDSKNSSVSGIEATSGAFEENETHAIPSLPEQSQSEMVRWNWANRNVDSSWFDFGDHEDLLELYGISEQDVQANDDEFCESPTWPGKQ
ncbi:unnamed protein product [Caenorhabditis brenneri]